MREGESLVCDVGGNPQPSVTWYRDGQAVGLPTYSSRKHAGKYTAQTRGHLGEKNFTVEVEVLVGSGRFVNVTNELNITKKRERLFLPGLFVNNIYFGRVETIE